MDLKKIKSEMIKYRDFYGGDISDTKAINDAKTEKELAEILDLHGRFLDDMLCDAQSHLDNFKKKVGLSIIP